VRRPSPIVWTIRSRVASAFSRDSGSHPEIAVDVDRASCSKSTVAVPRPLEPTL
jgi:hypothetical protein